MKTLISQCLCPQPLDSHSNNAVHPLTPTKAGTPKTVPTPTAHAPVNIGNAHHVRQMQQKAGVVKKNLEVQKKAQALLQKQFEQQKVQWLQVDHKWSLICESFLNRHIMCSPCTCFCVLCHIFSARLLHVPQLAIMEQNLIVFISQPFS